MNMTQTNDSFIKININNLKIIKKIPHIDTRTFRGYKDICKNL